MSNYSDNTRSELIAICKAKNIKGYSNKSKELIIQLLQNISSSYMQPTSINAIENVVQPQSSIKENKKTRGQFYTVFSNYLHTVKVLGIVKTI